ncbi:carbohydrate ABC transporter permease [Paenibacillus psychroresistens]|uniref:Carbohydrate ABC transporter permease n=1 Tax=Paenibacillus psychroresistens TaxID=1778678 RepID=A0A6B8RE70_9BACL|nr:carbohydrate ABC transporter permease [Paenibacillus psychroresistens]QGQ94519.1 carbohydrate ABC transporter permease [Paenibacillus psychroresistens]
MTLAWASKASKWIILSIWTLIVVIPLIILVSVSVKSPQDLLYTTLGFPKDFMWDNFAEAWKTASLGMAFGNSILITGLSILGVVLASSFAAYPLARVKSKFISTLFLYFIAGIMVPFQLSMIPLYKLLKFLHLINTHQGVILIFIAMSIPFSIFLYTGFLKGIPKELEESALIDGCGPFRTFAVIIFPLIKPVTASVIITNSLSIWNDFLVPLLFLQEKTSRTIPMAIFTFTGQYNSSWNMIFSAILLGTLPLIITFLLLQKHFIKGLVGGAVKG